VFMTTSSSSNSWRWSVEICHHCKAIDMQSSHRCFLTIVTFQDTMNLPTGHRPQSLICAKKQPVIAPSYQQAPLKLTFCGTRTSPTKCPTPLFSSFLHLSLFQPVFIDWLHLKSSEEAGSQ
jgi:hypothetical protein